jgi:hypothetical protein
MNVHRHVPSTAADAQPRLSFRPFLFLCTLGASLLSFLGVASADSTLASQPAIRDDLRRYYRAETTTGFLLVALGVTSALAGVALATRDSDLARGLGWSMIGFSAIGLLGGGGYARQSFIDRQVYAERLTGDPAAFKSAEQAHMQTRMSRYSFYRMTEFGLLIAGTALAFYGLGSNRDALKGVGFGIAIEALAFFSIDTFGHFQTRQYQAQVERFSPNKPNEF